MKFSAGVANAIVSRGKPKKILISIRMGVMVFAIRIDLKAGLTLTGTMWQ